MTYNIEEKKPMDMFRSGLSALDTRRQYPDIWHKKARKNWKSYDTETNSQLKLPREEKTERSEGSEDFKEQEEVHGQNSNVELKWKQ